jgi:hypothetical protein
MSVSISFDPHRANRSLRISNITNLRTGNCFDALVKTDVVSRCAARVQVAGSSRHAADRLVCGRLQRSQLRTAVFTQDLPSRAVTSTSSANRLPRAARYRASGFVLWPISAQVQAGGWVNICPGKTPKPLYRFRLTKPGDHPWAARRSTAAYDCGRAAGAVPAKGERL